MDHISDNGEHDMGNIDYAGKKLLILGSDYGTVQVVREAHKLGIYVIVTDLMETSPTKKLADEAWKTSTADVDILVKKCREENVTALMFGASDFNINNARQICKQLGLPIYCENDYAWRVARDKGEFKRICNAVGAPISAGYDISDELTEKELDAIVYPVVVKPVDKSGNRGMNYCANKAELVEAYKYARSITNNEILVERQLHGSEYNVHYVLAEGKARLLYFSSTHHEPGQADNLYSFKCTTSDHLQQYIEEVNESVIAVIEKAGCREGIVWVDCMRDDDGHFYLLEMGYRFGGVMTYVPYERVTGFNTVKWMLECALGIQHKEEDMPLALNHALKGCAASYHLFTTCEGEISSIEGLKEVERLPNVYIDMPKGEGNIVRYHACMGLIGIYGEDIDEICDTVEKINSLLKIKDRNGRNMFIYFDDYLSLRTEYKKGFMDLKK